MNDINNNKNNKMDEMLGMKISVGDKILGFENDNCWGLKGWSVNHRL